MLPQPIVFLLTSPLSLGGSGETSEVVGMSVGWVWAAFVIAWKCSASLEGSIT